MGYQGIEGETLEKREKGRSGEWGEKRKGHPYQPLSVRIRESKSFVLLRPWVNSHQAQREDHPWDILLIDLMWLSYFGQPFK